MILWGNRVRVKSCKAFPASEFDGKGITDACAEVLFCSRDKISIPQIGWVKIYFYETPSYEPQEACEFDLRDNHHLLSTRLIFERKALKGDRQALDLIQYLILV